MFPRASGYSLLFVLASLFLSGCSETSTSSRELSTPTYLFYATYGDDGTGTNTNRFGLTAVDPDSPTTPITIAAEAKLNKAVPVSYMAGTISGTNISDLHYRYLVYGTGVTAGTGELYRISARKGDGLYTTQLSSESAAADICEDMGTWNSIFTSEGAAPATAAYPDYANPLNSVYVYLKDTGGTDNCATPSSTLPNGSLTAVPYVVRLNQDAATAPYTSAANLAQYPVAPVYNADGSLHSLLFWTANSSSGYFTRRNIDSTLSWAQTVMTGVTTKPQVLGIGPSGQILLSVNNTLRLYDPATLTLSTTSLLNTTGVSPFTASDASAFYVRVGNTIYRVPYTATANTDVTAVVNEPTGTIGAGWVVDMGFFGTYVAPVNDMVISGSRLVYSLKDADDKTVFIRSVAATGGSPATIYTYVTGTTVGDTGMYRLRAAAGRIYLSLVDPIDAVSVADGGGSQVVYNNSRWVGFTYHPSTRLFGDFDKSGINMQPKSMFRIAYDAVNGDRLSTYDADTTSPLVDFGAIAPLFSSYLYSQIPDMLGITTSERTLFAYNNNLGGTDVAFLHARDGSSARQLTFNEVNGKQLVGMNNTGGCTLGTGDKFDPLLPLLAALSLLHLGRRRLRAWLSSATAKRDRRVGVLAATGLMALFAPGAQADDLVIVPGVGLGQSSMDFTRSTSENDQATFNVIEISLTAAYKGLYLRGSTELPLGESYSHGPALIRQFKREDASVTLGWHPFETFSVPALKSLSVFGGYSSGKTNVLTYDGGGGLPPYAVYTEYLDEGLYYGLGYSLRFGDSGSLSLNIAQASMDGSFLVQPSSSGGVTTTETGTTEGLSYGLTWGGSFRDKATYYLSWRQRSYTTDLVTISIDKQFRIISAGFIFPL